LRASLLQSLSLGAEIEAERVYTFQGLRLVGTGAADVSGSVVDRVWASPPLFGTGAAKNMLDVFERRWA
jgi:hypothetical protein